MDHFDIASRRRVLGAAVVAAGALLLTGCGGSGESGDSGGKGSARQDVASLHSDAPDGKATAQAAPSSDDGRPQLRLDSSEEEKNRYWHIYAQCLKEHGHKMIAVRGPDSVDDTDHSATAKAATKACASKLPLQPPEMDESTNPHYDDDYRAYVKCLNRKGLKVTALPDNSGWTYDGNTTLSADQQTQVDKSCTLEAFGGKTQ
ncbi:hypothetical protein GCM10010269_23540 [Streptomyces humidus]|uniref:Uncharacterized protein n=1 Tax=Streptomyces humidus TaxID=52259 RepID=A0A918L2V5_9ACTN|nr:hypothetical protein [Streptomyces humidus]GGR83723.1 hypothetical protein GCM10010269_23540 [Streptomyces humidus]